VLVVLFDHDAEMIDRVLQAALFECDAPELKVCVCFVVCDLNGFFET
jgi:hypothetical protein